jgi:hypothetical protein
LAKALYSKTPCGPFQNIVFALPITLSLALIVFGPISRPIHPSSIPSSYVL